MIIYGLTKSDQIKWNLPYNKKGFVHRSSEGVLHFSQKFGDHDIVKMTFSATWALVEFHFL